MNFWLVKTARWSHSCIGEIAFFFFASSQFHFMEVTFDVSQSHLPKRNSPVVEVVDRPFLLWTQFEPKWTFSDWLQTWCTWLPLESSCSRYRKPVPVSVSLTLILNIRVARWTTVYWMLLGCYLYWRERQTVPAYMHYVPFYVPFSLSLAYGSLLWWSAIDKYLPDAVLQEFLSKPNYSTLLYSVLAMSTYSQAIFPYTTLSWRFSSLAPHCSSSTWSSTSSGQLMILPLTPLKLNFCLVELLSLVHSFLTNIPSLR